jgi:hypothetical protein
VSVYAFVSQIVSYLDRELERDYLFGRALLASISVWRACQKTAATPREGAAVSRP